MKSDVTKMLEEAGCDENCETCSDYEEVPGPKDAK